MNSRDSSPKSTI